VTDHIATAQHEAAHIVVGVTLGLPFVGASLTHGGAQGWAAFELGATQRCPEAWHITLAAGVEWEVRYGCARSAGADLAELLRAGIRADARLSSLRACAWAILRERRALHGRITRALATDEGLTPPALRKVAGMVL
jgi:hypothetical protein